MTIWARTQDGLLHDQPRAWFVVVERQTYEGLEMEPYVVGPFGEAQADGELQSDEGIVFCLLTIDAKSEGYVAGGDVYTTTTPPVGPRIVPVRDMPELSAVGSACSPTTPTPPPRKGHQHERMQQE